VNSQNDVNNEDLGVLYLQLYAYTDNLLKKKGWFRGGKTDSFLKGKQIHDCVSEAIEKHLTNPEKYDCTTGRSLENYLKLHVIRTLVGNDSKSPENKTSKGISSIVSKNDEGGEEAGSYLDSILPYAEAYFDQEIDSKEIMSFIEQEIAKDKIVEEIYLGIRCYGWKRAMVIKEFNMSENDFDNGMRRMSTILNSVAKKYDIKKISI
jgi:hypothetical protein